jgi:ubiquinone/menaquinone biosynthesis C-methylase UbiE
MTLPRTLEPEVMDTAEDAEDYDAMDHSEVNARFIGDLLAFVERAHGSLGRVLDVGTGTALIPIGLCTRAPDVVVEAIDLADNMLALGRRNVERAELSDRISLQKLDAKKTAWMNGAFGVVVSNSIVHHIPEPADVLREMWRLVAKGGTLFVRDLLRPESAASVDALVDTYAPPSVGAEASVSAREGRQRALFAASLHAALTVTEVQAMVAPLGIAKDDVSVTSDRHWTLASKKP